MGMKKKTWKTRYLNCLGDRGINDKPLSCTNWRLKIRIWWKKRSKTVQKNAIRKSKGQRTTSSLCVRLYVN